MMEVYSLFSGSSGNATLLRAGGTSVLIDAGKSLRAVLRALGEAGVSPQDIAAVFVTHEHSDHVSALPQLAMHEGFPIHAAADTADSLADAESVSSVLVRHPPLYTEQIGCLTVTSFLLPHDSLCHVGYILRDGDGDAFCVATDMGHICGAVKEALAGCRGALLESNYDETMLRCGAYPAWLKARILSPRGHLSNADCASLAAYAASCGVASIALGHLSAQNNTPELVRASAETALAAAPPCALTICSRTEVTRIL